MLLDRALIADTWCDLGGGPKAILACTTLAVLSAAVAVGERMLWAMERAWAVRKQDVCSDNLSGRRRSQGTFCGVGLKPSRGLAMSLMAVPFLVWFTVFVGLPD